MYRIIGFVFSTLFMLLGATALHAEESTEHWFGQAEGTEGCDDDCVKDVEFTLYKDDSGEAKLINVTSQDGDPAAIAQVDGAWRVTPCPDAVVCPCTLKEYAGGGGEASCSNPNRAGTIVFRLLGRQ